MKRLLGACFLIGMWGSGVLCGQGSKSAGEPMLLGKPLTHWIKTLEDPEALAREEAILVLGSAGPAAKPAAAALTRLLKDELPSVRAQAAIALTQIGAPTKATTAVLLEVWKDGSVSLRQQIVPALGPLASETPAALDLLLQASVADDDKLRALALTTLVKIGPAAAPALTKVLENPNPLVRRQAIFALERLGPEARAAAAALAARLKDADWDCRYHAALALWPIARDRNILVPVLVEAAGKADPAARQTGLYWLFTFRPPPQEALPVFRLTLQHDQLLMRVRAAAALWELEKKAKDVLPIFITALQLPEGKNRENLMGRYEAVLALKSLRGEAQPARKELLEAIKNGNNMMLEQIPPVLARLGPESIPDLIDLVSGPRRPDQGAASQTLGLMGKEAVEPLIKLLDHNNEIVRHYAFQSLEIMGAEALPALPALRKALTSKKAGDRIYAAMCVASMGPVAKVAMPDLLDRASKDAHAGPHYALLALAHMQPEDQAMRPILHKALKSADAMTRLAAADWLWHMDQDPTLAATVAGTLKGTALNNSALHLLKRMGPAAQKEGVAALSKLLSENKQPYTCRWAAQNLGQMGAIAKEAVPDLVAALKNPNPDIRMWTAQALNHIGAERKQALATLLEIYDQDPTTHSRLMVVNVLKEFGPAAKDALPRLQALLPGLESHLGMPVAAAILAIDPDQIHALRPTLYKFLHLLPPHMSAVVAFHLLQADPKDQQANLALEDIMYSPSSGIRSYAFEVLEKGGPWAKAALPALHASLKDPEPHARIVVAKVLWKLDPGNTKTLPTLLAILRDKECPKCHPEVAAALGDLGPIAKDAVPLLQAALRSPEIRLRFAANEALRKIDAKAALPAQLEGYGN